nr:alpha glucosidase [uncultured Gellertiella sp.]
MTAGKALNTGADWWRGATIYQVYPRSFQDTTGDGTGDLKGLTQRLPYIAALGVDAIWLSPFFTSPQADMGYDVSDYCDVDPMFGSLADFDEMLKEAHRLGLKVIIDQVISHTSDQHPWFRESRSNRSNDKADWYVWADPKPDGNAPNNWLSVFGGPAWEWDGVRRQFYMHNFLASQPDLNFHCPAVQDAALQVLKFWLDRGVDGFRLDTVNYYFHDRRLTNNPPADPDAESGNDAPDANPYGMQQHLHDKSQPENVGFLQRIRALLDLYPDRTTVGEVGDGTRSLDTLAAYTSGGDKLHMCYTFDLLGPEFSAAHFRKAVSAFESKVREGWVCWAFSNHDVPRHVSRFIENPGERDHMAKLTITLLSALRGSICLYQGEELGLPEAELRFEELRDPYGIRFWPAFKGRDGCRTPMVWEQAARHAGFTAGETPWLPVSSTHTGLAVDRQESDPRSVLNHYRQTLDFRRENDVLRDGSFRFVETNQDLLVFEREKGDVVMRFYFNLTRGAISIAPDTRLQAGHPVDLPGFPASVASGHVELAPLSVACFRL